MKPDSGTEGIPSNAQPFVEGEITFLPAGDVGHQVVQEQPRRGVERYGCGGGFQARSAEGDEGAAFMPGMGDDVDGLDAGGVQDGGAVERVLPGIIGAGFGPFRGCGEILVQALRHQLGQRGVAGFVAAAGDEDGEIGASGEGDAGDFTLQGEVADAFGQVAVEQGVGFVGAEDDDSLGRGIWWRDERKAGFEAAEQAARDQGKSKQHEANEADGEQDAADSAAAEDGAGAGGGQQVERRDEHDARQGGQGHECAVPDWRARGKAAWIMPCQTDGLHAWHRRT